MITKDNNLKVMEVFFKNPSRSFHIRELSRITKLSSTGIIKIIKRLKNENLLVSKKEKITEEVRPTFNEKFYLMKRIYNIYSLYDTVLIKCLKDFYEEPEAIILFGSYSKGLDTEKSDIDLCIVTNKKDLPDLINFEKKLNRKINIINLNLNNIKETFKNSLANGMILEGYIKLIK
mgnify:CR=1 FL=1